MSQPVDDNKGVQGVSAEGPNMSYHSEEYIG